MKLTLNHLEDKGIYHFVLPYGEFLINGEKFSNLIYSGKEMTTSTIPCIQEVTTRNKLQCYTSDDGSTLTKEEFTEKLLEINVQTDSDGNMRFETLEDEYQYKKFMQKYSPQYAKEELYKDVEITIQRCMLDCGSKYITAMFSLDTSNADLVKFERLRLQRDVLSAWALENKVQVDIPTHGGLKFAKINNKYVFSDDTKYNECNPVLTLTLDQALAKELEVKKDILGVLISTITPVSSIDSIMLVEVQKKLQEVINLAQQNKTKHLVEIIKITKELKQLTTI